MKTKPIEGKPALEEFTRTMKTLFSVPKSAVQQDTRTRKTRKKNPKQQHA